MEFSAGKMTAIGAFVEQGGVFLRMPGIRNVAGETLWLALMPPQPAPISATATSINMNFHWNLTCRV